MQGFEIAGSDGKWVWSDCVIDGATVVVSHAGVPSPTQVRYAFNNAINYANLFNADGLPALMFTTQER